MVCPFGVCFFAFVFFLKPLISKVSGSVENSDDKTLKQDSNGKNVKSQSQSQSTWKFQDLITMENQIVISLLWSVVGIAIALAGLNYFGGNLSLRQDY
mmetsp:Transcript_3224/g.4096  ORF Transcript_3224/g.4096 Transcript_3224/m.4096 type:complete len:98 (+) Transcript_3224:220-513(+)